MKSEFRVNAIKVAVGAILIIALTKLSGIFEPWGAYFTFSSFLYGFPTPITWSAIIIKFAIPFFSGIVIGAFSSDNPRGTAAASGFLASFILAWPAIVEWSDVAPAHLQEKQKVFLLVYIFYYVSYAYLSVLGARLCTLYFAFQSKRRGKTRSDILADLLDWKDTLKPAVVGVMSGIVSLMLAKLFEK